MRRRTLLLILFACAVPRFAAFAVWRADPATLYYDLSTALLREHRFALDGRPAARIVLGAWHDGATIARWDERGCRLETLPS